MTVYCLRYQHDGRDIVERFDSATGRALRMIELPAGTACELSETSEPIEARNAALLYGQDAPAESR